MSQSRFLVPDLSDDDDIDFVESLQVRDLGPRRRAPSSWTRSAIGVTGIAAVFGVAAYSTAGFLSRRRAGLEDARTILRLDSEEKCHTAVAGDPCFLDVSWAMNQGIKEHPDWYAVPCPRLSPDSSFEAFQACVVRINMTSCPLPCDPADKIPDDVMAALHVQAEKSRPAPRSDPCHIAKKGEICYDRVVEAMKTGIITTPEKFPGLAVGSTFEQFQDALHKDPQYSSLCPKSCSCHTSVEGESCYKHVMWAKQTGLAGHPDWYHGITVDSTFEEIQAYLHKDAKGSCDAPCTKVEGVATAPALPKPHLAGPQECVETQWPDRAGGLICGKCKVLVDKFETKYKTCDAYCTSVGRRCTGAWEEVDNTCQAMHVMDCGETMASSDALCECGEKASAAPAAPGLGSDPSVDLDVSQQLEEQMKRQEAAAMSGKCHTAVEGETCYDDVMFGMNKGIHEHPEWYDGLSVHSSFEDFQQTLHENPELSCPKPCVCHTSTAGDECNDNVKWVLREGIEKHPDWYQGLNPRSRFEEVQARLHEDKNTMCPQPCKPAKWETPSLFCISVFRSAGYEMELVTAQLEKKVGIFGCDEFAVLSDKKLPLAEGVVTLVLPPSGTVGKSKDGTAANTLIFMQAWTVIWFDVRWRAHDWIIKADPDAVLVPLRLRQHLAPHNGKNVYAKNCMKYQGPGWPMMFGSVEAFSQQALDMYFKGAKRCRDELQWQVWGEDLFMGNCLNMLGGGSIFDGGLVGDGVCKGGNCADKGFAAYHPYKSVDSWFNCYHQAIR